MTTTPPLISVGMPVYNGERYVAQAIEAILAQTYANFELVISDNASTDATVAICEAYAAHDPRIRVHRNESNRGGDWNFRQVFHLSKGKYFRWAAYDDLCAPTHLEACLGPLEAHPEVVLCYPRSVMIDEYGQQIGEHYDGLNLRSPLPVQRYAQFHERYRHGTFCNPIFGLIRSDVLARTQVHGAYPSSDIVLMGELAMRGQFYEVPGRLFLRRNHPAIPVRMFKSMIEMMIWHNPEAGWTARHPVMRLFYEHLAAVQRTPLLWRDRLGCQAIVMRWLGWQAQSHLARLARAASAPGQLTT
jgi:glycosyltransferase involved in cell wall biosynthesis